MIFSDIIVGFVFYLGFLRFFRNVVLVDGGKCLLLFVIGLCWGFFIKWFYNFGLKFC